MSPKSSDDNPQRGEQPTVPPEPMLAAALLGPVSGPWQVPASAGGGLAQGPALRCLLALDLPLEGGLP